MLNAIKFRTHKIQFNNNLFLPANSIMKLGSLNTAKKLSLVFISTILSNIIYLI